MSDTTLSDRKYQLDFDIEKSLRYHQRRRRHYEFLHRAIMLGIIVAGSAAFADFYADGRWFGLISAVLAAVDLVYGLSHKARDHQDLHRRFTELAKAIRTTHQPTDADLDRWTRERLDIESDEPPVFWALEASCFNEVAMSRGHPRSEWVPLKQWQKLLMHWRPFEHFGDDPRDRATP